MKSNKKLFVVISILLAILISISVIKPPSKEIIYGEKYYKYFADNARHYFEKWGWSNDTIYSEPEALKHAFCYSYYIYVIGHGSSRYIVINKTILRPDIIPNNRLPYNFVMICSCGALNVIGNGTWEGCLNRVGYKILVGYTNMTSRVFTQAYGWQNKFFYYLDKGYTFGEAFDKACRIYLLMREHVKIYGNLSLKIKDLTIPPYDLNKDAHVNILDLVIVSQHWTG